MVERRKKVSVKSTLLNKNIVNPAGQENIPMLKSNIFGSCFTKHAKVNLK